MNPSSLSNDLQSSFFSAEDFQSLNVKNRELLTNIGLPVVFTDEAVEAITKSALSMIANIIEEARTAQNGGTDGVRRLILSKDVLNVLKKKKSLERLIVGELTSIEDINKQRMKLQKLFSFVDESKYTTTTAAPPSTHPQTPTVLTVTAPTTGIPTPYGRTSPNPIPSPGQLMPMRMMMGPGPTPIQPGTGPVNSHPYMMGPPHPMNPAMFPHMMMRPPPTASPAHFGNPAPPILSGSAVNPHGFPPPTGGINPGPHLSGGQIMRLPPP